MSAPGPARRHVPAVNTLAQAALPHCPDVAREHVVEIARRAIADARTGAHATDLQSLLEEVCGRARELTAQLPRSVINATGVVLHTGLGRAPLSSRTAEALARVARGYSAVELDLEDGARGARDRVTGDLLTLLCGSEAALVVNNNAAAVLLALTALCRGREVLVSRGQLVEIGGGFRMPEVMRLSGARLVEVGTTNRTRAQDFRDAIGARTGAILRVHPSNFAMTGFVESVGITELATVAREAGVLLLDDLGSGLLRALPATATVEPYVRDSVAAADVVMFSGDKLTGGPQAGIVAGRALPLRRMAGHPLARALRADKLQLAALRATLQDHLAGGQDLPVTRMLGASTTDLRVRARRICDALIAQGVPASVTDGVSEAGGGAMPGDRLATTLVAVRAPGARLSRLATALRRGEPAILCRVERGRLLADPRTVDIGEEELLVRAIGGAWSRA
ncbi:MAG: L-seryl-tRNA(Sec) selenium transferase [Candidatus Dormibacteria bacterium]